LITLSARASTFGGMVRPICFAAFQIDHQLELRRLVDGEISRLRNSSNCLRSMQRAGSCPHCWLSTTIHMSDYLDAVVKMSKILAWGHSGCGYRPTPALAR
jgi:hypothetical protein